MEHRIRTGRLELEPVSWRDIDDVARLKANAGAMGLRGGGVRSRGQSEADMAAHIFSWGRDGVGIFAVREGGRFVGMAGVWPAGEDGTYEFDYALFPSRAGRGLTREAAGAALAFAHDVGVRRIVAHVQDADIVGRKIIGGSGMAVCQRYAAPDGRSMLLYHSVRVPGGVPAGTLH
ncbi:GNAT family N-acetyltransferase [Novacetimonas pomaceti]|uniref:GNAT family N-acetyltransferase n=1 Tax=Novacetimonas pomaceti TaxID=2021998 RepID=A0ABX5NZQ1_9PROT|nr:GNAT family N-acetyltransferase [Novacetimonas pomaceti]PYD46990.1 GNAT family N-acetyltransferase [Novacetimonas pomaceti]